ncbi:MAG TPA: M28 family peptidase [Armatimonadetes bacterium]|nr:M28 family peptidase [Armatimonadota bacterium]
MARKRGLWRHGAVASGARSHRVWVALLLLTALLPGQWGCHSAADSKEDAPAQNGGAAAPSPQAPDDEFDGERSMAWLRKQVDAGFRVPGTETHAAVRRMLVEGLGPTAQVQEFTYQTRQGHLPLANIIATYGPAEGDRVLLCAHWDTRPFADQDPNPAHRNRPIPGANDGASGVAVLMELSRLFRATPPPVGVTIVLFDGEDWGRDLDEMFLGSRYFADHPVGGPFRYAILLDMVGDADLQIPRERHSHEQARAIVDKVWQAAAELGYSQFRASIGPAIYDDHLPLLRKGIPAIDIIDFDYPYWHTLQDTTDKCSPASLKIVGDVVRRVVYAER